MKAGALTLVILFCSLFINAVAVIYLGYKYYLRISFRSNPEQNTINNFYWQDKVAFYDLLNQQQKGGVFLVGDSMFDRLNIEEALPDLGVRNRGIGFDNTHSLTHRLEKSVLIGAPRKIILFIGGNDLSKCDDVSGVIADTEQIIDTILNNGIDLAVVSLLPKGKNYVSSRRNVGEINKDILYFNEKIQRKCIKKEIVFVDITKHFVSEDFFLDKRFTSDEIHLNAQGVLLLAELLRPYIANRTSHISDS